MDNCQVVLGEITSWLLNEKVSIYKLFTEPVSRSVCVIV